MALLGRAQVAFFLEAVQQRIKGSQADPVPVPGELFGHFQSEDRFFDGVMKDMQPDKARVKIPIFKLAISDFRYRHSIAL